MNRFLMIAVVALLAVIAWTLIGSRQDAADRAYYDSLQPVTLPACGEGADPRFYHPTCTLP